MAVLILEILIFILALVLNPRARRRRARAEKTGGIDSEEAMVETLRHLAPEASESGMPLPPSEKAARHQGPEAGVGRHESERKAVERYPTVESGTTLVDEGHAGEKKGVRKDEAV